MQRVRDAAPGEELVIEGFVRTRRRGNQRLLFVDVNLQSLLEEEETEHAVTNDQHDMYYKYKTSFSPSDDTVTLIFYSPDTLLHVGSETISCDQMRKLLSVGSRIHCIAHKDDPSLYEDPNTLSTWLQNFEPNGQVLVKVTQIIAFHTSRPEVHESTAISHGDLPVSKTLSESNVSDTVQKGV